MTPGAQDRFNIIGLLAEREITLEEAAQALQLSSRQVERLRAAYNKAGHTALNHGNQGRTPAHATPPEVRDRIIELATGKYAGFNHTYLTELLVADEHINVARATVHRILHAAHIGSPQPTRRRSQHRVKRPRRERAGAMLQMDGSTHRWCEDRAGKMTIISAIDDATSRLWCIGRESEDLEGYMRLLRSIILQWGIPGSIYTDRSALAAGASNRFKMVDKIHLGPSQLKRALTELGSILILANSAEAKGRIERSNATLQDRLVSYLHSVEAQSLRDLNFHLTPFLEHHNSRFVRPPESSTPGWKTWDLPFLIDDVLCIKESRVVARDHTVRVFGATYRISLDVVPGQLVMVHRRFDGSTGIFSGWKLIAGDAASPAPGEGRPVR